jgi:lipopolysaccharide/colanic/teichoic acid biosynthesis glycosyltransferase
VTVIPREPGGRWTPRTGYRGKRLFDLAVSSTGLLIFAPLLAVLWFLVRALLGSPAIFRQRRPGLHAVPFDIVKFRTMTDERGADGSLLPDAARLTGLGRFLRKTSLDELPELWNVLRGEMSLVGPRPLLVEYLPHYSARENRRHEVRPGITGLAQVTGRNTIEWRERLELDAQYVESASFGQDLRILWRTVGAVLGREGVAVDTDEVETRLDQERDEARKASVARSEQVRRTASEQSRVAQGEDA